MPTQDSQQILRAKHCRHTTFLVKLFPARFADPTSKDQAVPALAHIRVSPNFGRYRLWADLLRGGDIHLFQLAIGMVTPDSNPDIFAVHKQYGFRFSRGMLADYLSLAVCGQPVQRHAKDSRDFRRGGDPLCRKFIYVSPNFLLVAACVAGDNDPPGHTKPTSCRVNCSLNLTIVRFLIIVDALEFPEFLLSLFLSFQRQSAQRDFQKTERARALRGEYGAPGDLRDQTEPWPDLYPLPGIPPICGAVRGL